MGIYRFVPSLYGAWMWITALKSIKVMTNWMVNEASKTSSNKLELLIKMLSTDGVLLWTALADSFRCCVFPVNPPLLGQIFLWPINCMNNFVNKEESTAAWLELYTTISPYLHSIIHKDIINELMFHCDPRSYPSCLFALRATIAVLEKKLQLEDTHFDREMQLLLYLTWKVNETQIKLMLPSLAVVIVRTLTALNENINEDTVEAIMYIINNILKICKVIFEEQPDNGSDLINYIRNIFNSLESTFKLDSYSTLKSNLVDQLIVCAPYLKNDKLLQNHILAIYKTHVNQNLADNISEEVIKAFENVEVSNSVNLTIKLPENQKEKLQSKAKPSSNLKNSAPSQINLERPSRVKRKPKKFDDFEFAVTKRRCLLSRNSQDNVEITGNQIQINATDNTKDKHKENNADSLESINNPIHNAAVINGDNNTVKHHGNDKLGNKISLRTCFVVLENLDRTNDAIKKFLDKKKAACLDSKNRALSTRTLRLMKKQDKYL